jgi:hypothetical protein
MKASERMFSDIFVLEMIEGIIPMGTSRTEEFGSGVDDDGRGEAKQKYNQRFRESRPLGSHQLPFTIGDGASWRGSMTTILPMPTGCDRLSAWLTT